MAHRSGPALLSLHGVRVLGAPSIAQIGERFRLPAADVREHLLDAQAYGWVTRHDYFGETWSMTERGRAENERQLAAELEAIDARAEVASAHADFVRLNGRHGVACTNWQLRPTPWSRHEFNDHSDPDLDLDVLLELNAVDQALQIVNTSLTRVLTRFGGYARLHAVALARVRRGEHEWLDGPDRASCQVVWIQLHEDLLATLGIPRGSDG